jgi:hypothetical protein
MVCLRLGDVPNHVVRGGFAECVDGVHELPFAAAQLVIEGLVARHGF